MPDRLDAGFTVIGAGIFGMFATKLLAHAGFDVVLIEQDSMPMNRASFVNQSRLHVGMHYPRSILTALSAQKNHDRFRHEFPNAIHTFDHIYGIAKNGSITDSQSYRNFLERAKVSYLEVEPSKWFHPGSVDSAYLVNEPSFDSPAIKTQIFAEISELENVRIFFNERVTKIDMNEKAFFVRTDSKLIDCQRLIIATYAGINTLRRFLDLPEMPLEFELTEVVLGYMPEETLDMGFTVMDGPFWSLMPFGNSGLHSLTTVNNTPLLRAKGKPKFKCQSKALACNPDNLADCNLCPAKPDSLIPHHIQQMKQHSKYWSSFTPTGSLVTVKTILSSSMIDDARPTLVLQDLGSRVFTILSGKISGIFELEEIFS